MTRNESYASYADLTVKVGLNLQPGQRLLIIGPLATFLIAAVLLQNHRKKLRGGSAERAAGGYR